MMDPEDEGTRTGVWVALGVVFFVLTGVIGGLVLRHLHGKGAAAPTAGAAKAHDAHAGHGVALPTVAGAVTAAATAVEGAASGAATAVEHAASGAVGAAAAAASGVATAAEKAASGAATAALAAATGVIDLLDGPIRGERLAKVYFPVGVSKLPQDAARTLELALKTMKEQGDRTLVLSGFHDTTGDPAKNAELAKQRAIAVRDALVAAGADASRIKLRKPESTTGSGDNQEARRVELRMVKD